MIMRKFFIFICMIIIISFNCTEEASAADSNSNVVSSYTVVIDNELICETIIEENTIEPMNPKSYSAMTTKKGSKTTLYKNSSGATMWYVKVSGSFEYNGTYSRCTSSFVTANSYSSAWKVTNKTSSYSGNTAKASATGTQYYGSSVLTRINKSLSLSCSNNGTLY